MRRNRRFFLGILGLNFAVLASLAPTPLAAQFNSGSTGANGPFPPVTVPGGTTSIVVSMLDGVVTFLPSGTPTTLLNVPPGGFADGKLNFTSFTVPSTVRLRFNGNTPVDIRAQFDVNINGTIDLDGGDGGDDGTGGGGLAGVGGFNGGQGGFSVGLPGIGLGPGGGGPSGGGGGHSGQGGASGGIAAGDGGPAYGTALLRPLIGGSGGAGATTNSGGLNVIGPGGGGGGGAIGIASSTKISIDGAILARGGAGGERSFGSFGSAGSGAGGGIRLIANRIEGGGLLRAGGGTLATFGGTGSPGRIRLEAFELTFTGSSDGARTNGVPGPIEFTNGPTIRIFKVGGESAPEHPSGALGAADVLINAAGTKQIDILTTNVPADTTVTVVAKPAAGGALIGPASEAVPPGADPRMTSVDLDFPEPGLYFIEAQTGVSP